MGLALLKNRFLSIIIQNLLQHNTAYEVSIAKKITEQSVARMSQASLVDHVILDRQLKLAGDFLIPKSTASGVLTWMFTITER